MGRGKIGWPSKWRSVCISEAAITPLSHRQFVDLDQSVVSLGREHEEAREVGGSLAGNELLSAKFFAKVCECLRESYLSNDPGQ